MLTVTITGDGLRRFIQLSNELGSGKAHNLYSKAINDTGAKAATATGRALSDQSGVSKKVGRKAVARRTRSTPATLAYEIHVKGGDIALKYFKARETRNGVSAAPRNQRQVFAGTFLKAGWWPKRVTKSNWNGHVFRRAGDKFQVAKSDVVLPTEATSGQTADTFDRGKNALDVRVSHYLRRLAGGALS
ncbi:hypothetical protein [Rhizobium laguerreae]|uniref:hypothetical protein n=1 Tax=Rhizobium laguerreae TaxID=1076926 RepID=UPI001C928132|nr:hypothetical protein [Rhizobium laguerreae]MBY3434834.1 hypothetical protein [Rhizobium laguerreae]MBY3448977.1 hypothetical protein [Rhizobium laguerreae]MBY3456751.1 hypothetical protein [Rhizobium laguerreae]